MVFIFIKMFSNYVPSLKILFFVVFTGLATYSFSQNNLLLNGNFEDINTCKEYNAQCGVEGWFYLRDVKVQMIGDEEGTSSGANSFAVFYDWTGFKEFTPIVGTILPCRLQSGKQYVFKGWISARLNPKLILKPGLCMGTHFYVPGRAFSKEMKPDSIVRIKPVPETPFFEIEYSFIATGEEQYFTFGTFVKEDTESSKRELFGKQTVTLMMDNFTLTPIDPTEGLCAGYKYNKENIYKYDHRHKDMDYTLFGKGLVPVALSSNKEDNVTRFQAPPPPPARPDTLKLGDVLFDFNKAELKTNAFQMLQTFFKNNEDKRKIDSIYIEGHTDSVGSDTKNLALSQQRSASVMQWVVSNSILGDDRITIHAFGRTRPIATNKTITGRALNRRVEIIVFRKQEQ